MCYDYVSLFNTIIIIIIRSFWKNILPCFLNSGTSKIFRKDCLANFQRFCFWISTCHRKKTGPEQMVRQSHASSFCRISTKNELNAAENGAGKQYTHAALHSQLLLLKYKNRIFDFKWSQFYCWYMKIHEERIIRE